LTGVDGRNPQLDWPSSPGYAVRMAKRKLTTTRRALKWVQGRSRVNAGWQIVPYNESTGRYRINHYAGVSELPYFVLIAGRGSTRAEQISRHNTLEEAKAACEQHLRQFRG
jgi:hypothetical protein